MNGTHVLAFFIGVGALLSVQVFASLFLSRLGETTHRQPDDSLNEKRGAL